MGGKKNVGENSKKAAGQARKAETAASKKAVEDSKKAAEEDKQWQKGSKSNAKKCAAHRRTMLITFHQRMLTGNREDAEAKKAEAAKKKADRDAQLAAEEASQPSKPKGGSAKSAQKKASTPSRGLDLSQLDDDGPSSRRAGDLSASGIDNALDALSLTNKDTSKIDRHPERRFKAAYAAFEARRMPEIEEENPGLRRNQRIEACKKEFEKSEENPFNQVHVAFDATRDEVAMARQSERTKVESRLTSK